MEPLSYKLAGGSTGIDTREAVGLGVVHLAWGEIDLGADEGVVRVALGAVHAAGVLHAVEVSLFAEYHVQLVPVLESLVAP